MNRTWLSTCMGLFGLMGSGLLLLSLGSCGRSQELVSIQIQPAVETIGATNIPVDLDAGQQVQLRALGSYIHPPVTKDVTSQATWSSNDTQMFTVDATGVLTATGNACGSTLVSATVTTNSSTGGISSTGAIVTGYMTATVVCYQGTGTGAGPALTVTFGGTGAGTVASNPAGLSCASSAGACVAQFPTGTVVTLTATPTGSSTFGSWTGCASSPSTNPCTVDLESNTSVTATFN
ncbi:MAG TPA: hypothetical protein VMG31_03695 [Verrucomicrobiae bacterium]|nr:hypothetical protein [Verrucomicrobiae bacterium]